MKAALPLGLVIIGMTMGHAAWAAPDWAETCATVGHFAGLVAAERDQRVQADAAVSTARRILDEPWMITDEVGAEVAGQVYGTPQRSPAEENAALRAECLTPVRERARIVVGAPIELNLGTNHIKRVTTDGRDADITLAWHDDGDGRGHDVFTVIVAGAGPVMTPSGGDTIHDDPDHDRDMRAAVRFARGQVDGRDTTLLLTATRQPGSGPTPTIYRVFRLSRQDDTYRFVPVLSEQLARSCNADMALSVAARLPLRSSYRGAPTANGCPPSSEIARKE